MVLFESLVNGLIHGSIYAMFAASFTLIFGVMDIPNMSHAALFAGGAYVFYALFGQMGLPWPVALIVAIIAIALLSAVIENYLLTHLYDRDPQDYIFGVILVTLGLATILERFYSDFFGAQPFYLDFPFLENNGFMLFGKNVAYLDLTIVLLALTSFAFLYWLNNYTITGYGLRAIVQDRELAHMKGIDVDRLFLIAFTLGGVMISVAGIVYGGKFALTPAMGFDLLVKAFIIVILGGIGNILGAGVAGYALGIYEAYATQFLNSYYIVSSEFAILILFFLLKAVILSEGQDSIIEAIREQIKGHVIK
jgi:branched-chain amino acid transport system permease protein